VDEALDLVQDAMFTFVSRYGERTAPEWPPLFRRTLQSRITDWHRRHLLRNALRHWFPPDNDSDPIQELIDPLTADLASIMGREAFWSATQRAIQALPLRQQQAFLLRIWEGLDVAETAEAMGCSEGSVKTHLSRALQVVRRKLEGFR
jgi:RNA polymerase sigma-70 factor (ECF subfamily)